jgi:hypothetical protein
MKFSLALPALLALLGACRSAGVSPWSPGFVPPGYLETPRVHLEPLGPRHAELDHAAFMANREYLRRTLHWGEWPREDMTVEENEADLQRHWTQFALREAYAYTVLSPDRTRCLGCVYLEPERIEFGADPSVLLAYWVRESELAGDLDRHLIGSMLEWLVSEWPFKTVFFAPHVDDVRARDLAAEFGMRPVVVSGEGVPDRAVRAWSKR